MYLGLTPVSNENSLFVFGPEAEGVILYSIVVHQM